MPGGVDFRGKVVEGIGLIFLWWGCDWFGGGWGATDGGPGGAAAEERRFGGVPCRVRLWLGARFRLPWGEWGHSYVYGVRGLVPLSARCVRDRLVELCCSTSAWELTQSQGLNPLLSRL